MLPACPSQSVLARNDRAPCLVDVAAAAKAVAATVLNTEAVMRAGKACLLAECIADRRALHFKVLVFVLPTAVVLDQSGKGAQHVRGDNIQKRSRPNSDAGARASVIMYIR